MAVTFTLAGGASAPSCPVCGRPCRDPLTFQHEAREIQITL